MKILQILLWVFVPIYAFAIKIWHLLYQKGWWGSTAFSIPVIAVGNLQAGGTGKTPLVAWLAENLEESYRVGILSRGYKRLTFGFRMSQKGDTYKEIGDEPAFFVHRLPNAAVAVSANRIEGIPSMLSLRPDINLIILDDAYQQLAIRPKLNILLTTYHRPFSKDNLLPAGRLREPLSAQERADIIVVNYCPKESLADKERALKALDIKAQSHQHIFLCSIWYSAPYQLFYEGAFKTLHKDEHILLFTGIADATPLIGYLKQKGLHLHHLEYRDHHRYIENDIENIHKNFEKLAREHANIRILTTEKDAMRLLPLRKKIEEKKLEIYIQPMLLDWGAETDKFLETVKSYL